jgi:hypothetical protein
MPLKPCRRVHHAEVVERVLFVTRNSLKSQKDRKLLSPVSNTCAITQKLYTHSRPTAFEKLPGTQINVPRLNLHKRPRHRRCPASRDFVPWRFSDAGRRSAWIASSCRHPKTYTKAEVKVALTPIAAELQRISSRDRSVHVEERARHRKRGRKLQDNQNSFTPLPSERICGRSWWP